MQIQFALGFPLFAQALFTGIEQLPDDIQFLLVACLCTPLPFLTLLLYHILTYCLAHEAGEGMHHFDAVLSTFLVFGELFGALCLQVLHGLCVF